MKVTVGEIINANEALKQVNGDYPSKLSYSLAKLQSSFSASLIAFEKVRGELIKKYGEEHPDKNFKVTDANISIYIKEINDVCSAEDSTEFSPINISLFDGINFSKEFFVLMGKFISE